MKIMLGIRAEKCIGMLLIYGAVGLSALCHAQATAAGSSLPAPSKADAYGSFSTYRPFNSDIYGQTYDSISGFIIGGRGYLGKTLGIEGEYSRYFNHPDYCYSSIQGGPVLRWEFGRLVPFVHALAGGAQVGPSYQHNGASNACKWGWAVTGGAGIDYVLPIPALRNRFAIRPIQADFNHSDVNYGSQVAPNTLTGGQANITAYRLSAGFVLRFGHAEIPEAASLGCEVQPVSVYPGDPITVTVRVLNLQQGKNQTPSYKWETNAGHVRSNGESATISTIGVAPGDYTIRGHVHDGSGPQQNAECTASFRVMAFEPPTVACSAEPSTIMPGGFSLITAIGRSAQNRNLSYSFNTSGGQISATGNTARLSANDVSPGTVHVTCNVMDDRGASASAVESISIAAPPPAPAPRAEKLCSISFERDRKRPVRVDNEAKGCLDDIALRLNRDSNAALVIVGKHDPGEKPDAAAERALNAKQYMTDEKGIDPARIKLRTGETSGRMVDNFLLAPGASWDPTGTESFDPNKIERHGEPYAPNAPRKR